MNLNALLSELALSFRVEIWTDKRVAVGGHPRVPILRPRGGNFVVQRRYGRLYSAGPDKRKPHRSGAFVVGRAGLEPATDGL
jgi:hypothetical protein